VQKLTGREIAYKTKKIAGWGVKEAKRRRVFLGFGLIGVVADGLEAEHSDYVFIFFSAGFCVDSASHLAGLVERWFFVYKEDEAQCSGGFFVCEVAGESKVGSDGGCVVVCAG